MLFSRSHSITTTPPGRRAPAVRRRVLAVTAAGAFAAHQPSTAQDTTRSDEARPEASRHHLFHPTPRPWLRGLSADRPDQTESPYTVDAGRFQVEMDLVKAVWDSDTSGGDAVRTTSWGTSLNLKAGLLDRVDLQFVLDPYVSERVERRSTGAVTEASGLGDLQTRLKINLWGNDGGRTAFAVMPFVKWPLSASGLRNGETEGGLILPFSVELPAGWGMGMMTAVGWVSDGAGGHDPEYFNTLTFGHDLVGELAGYVEFAALVAPESGAEWQGQLGVGFTYGLGANTQLDLGCNFGVTESAPDFNPFLGVTFRF